MVCQKGILVLAGYKIQSKSKSSASKMYLMKNIWQFASCRNLSWNMDAA